MRKRVETDTPENSAMPRSAGRLSLRRRLRRALTLIEMAVVLLVIGILIGVLYATIDFGITDDAHRAALNIKSRTLPMHLDNYEREVGRLTDGSTLNVLAEPSSQAPGYRPVDRDLVRDPWGNYFYICRDNRGNRQICSYGEDGQPGGTGKESDFYLTDRSSWPTWLGGTGEN